MLFLWRIIRASMYGLAYALNFALLYAIFGVAGGILSLVMMLCSNYFQERALDGEAGHLYHHFTIEPTIHFSSLVAVLTIGQPILFSLAVGTYALCMWGCHVGMQNEEEKILSSARTTLFTEDIPAGAVPVPA